MRHKSSRTRGSSHKSFRTTGITQGAVVVTFRHVLSSSRMLGRLFTLPVVAALATLLPLAHASPPDQSWIAGLYDGADHDDAVLAITDATGSPGINGSDHPPVELSSSMVALVLSTRPGAMSRIRLVDRAPPLS
jgi:hypothetical protein